MMQRHMPIGYKLADGKIQLDEPKAAVVKKIFADYLSGASTSALAKRLTEMDFRMPTTKPPGTTAPSVRYLRMSNTSGMNSTRR